MSQIIRRRCLPLLLSISALLSATLSANAFSISYVRSVIAPYSYFADGKRLSPTSSARATTASGNVGASTTLSNAELKEELLKRIETLVSVLFCP